jgi:hypothetical protein
MPTCAPEGARCGARQSEQANANRAAAAARDADLRLILEAMRDRTLREIAEALTNRGIKTPRGGDTWNQVTVMRAMWKRCGTGPSARLRRR